MAMPTWADANVRSLASQARVSTRWSVSNAATRIVRGELSKTTAQYASGNKQPAIAIYIYIHICIHMAVGD